MYVLLFLLLMFAFIFGCVLLLLLNQQFNSENTEVNNWSFRKTTNTLFMIVILITLLNVMTTFLECGFKNCPSDPVTYRYLNQYLQL